MESQTKINTLIAMLESYSGKKVELVERTAAVLKKEDKIKNYVKHRVKVHLGNTEGLRVRANQTFIVADGVNSAIFAQVGNDLEGNGFIKCPDKKLHELTYSVYKSPLNFYVLLQK